MSCQNSYVEILTPKVVVLGGGVFGKHTGLEGGALMTGISALFIEIPLLPPPCEDTERQLSVNKESSPHHTPNLLAPSSLTSSLWNCEK